MAKKQQWKAQIRAEVAAAMQGARPRASALPESRIKPPPGQGPAEAGNQKVGEATNRTQAGASTPETLMPTGVTTHQDIGLIRKDLGRIAVVTTILVIILAGVTVADRRTDFLTILYDKASRSVAQLGAAQSPPPTADETSPAADSPTETDQSAPAAAE